MGRYLPAHQYKLGNKTIGLTQADNYAFALVVESAKKKTYKEILEYYEANFIKSPDVHNLLIEIVKREEAGMKPLFKHRSN